ncbi:hypothetical protein [Facilibium subflavum]|uniref:hypothetical protein n=1 Tax=Facilibium subflavum TaxID=2219058 RepID=UPI000E6542AB|nr:hypothetical protein [Facilibium subflavum]
MQIYQINWDKGREMLANTSVDPSAIATMENCVHKDDYFYIASYDYGEKIVEKGRLLLPKDLDHNQCDDLLYNEGSNPTSIILSGAAELYLENEGQIIPYSVFKQGSILGSWLALDGFENSYHPRFIWDMVAGVRSAFIINNIHRERNHNHLCKALGISFDRPENILQHFDIFKSIYQASHATWQYKVFIFPKKVVQQFNSRWRPFKNYLMERAWNGSGYMRNAGLWHSIYSIAAARLNLRLSAYDLSCIKHIIGVSTGNELGFEPCINNDMMPLDVIQKAYYEAYGLKQLQQTPSIMIPVKKSVKQPVYYSFQYPNNIEVPIKVDSYNSGRKYANYLNGVFNKMLPEIIHIASSQYSPIAKTILAAKYDFCDSTHALEKDPRFFYYAPSDSYLMNNVIPKHNKFLRSYIMIQ